MARLGAKALHLVAMANAWNWSPTAFPSLTPTNSEKTSEQRNTYNCIAWAAGETRRWWWPLRLPGVSYWPKGAPREVTIEAFIAAYATCGFIQCANASLEDGTEKIALYAKAGPSGPVPTHAARQLENGEWTSKLGALEDITHTTLDAVSGPLYGVPVAYLSRPRPST